MATLRTDDPIADFNQRDRQEAVWLESRPVCDNCREHIQDDTAVRIAGKLICESCIAGCREVISE